jgi:hypothetical protein
MDCLIRFWNNLKYNYIIMSNLRTTLLTNVFNEEYLLPFWLYHHKDMFDDIIIVDYNSTDKSLDICKLICPRCKIIKTRNKFFDAEDIDKEFRIQTLFGRYLF